MNIPFKIKGVLLKLSKYFILFLWIIFYNNDIIHAQMIVTGTISSDKVNCGIIETSGSVNIAAGLTINIVTSSSAIFKTGFHAISDNRNLNVYTTSKSFESGDIVLDCRNGTIPYSTIKLGDQDWMSINMKTGGAFNPSSSADIYWLHGNYYFYTLWNALYVCPSGWELPKTTDYQYLSSNNLFDDLNLPLLGIHDYPTGTWSGIGDWGFYWTSSGSEWDYSAISLTSPNEFTVEDFSGLDLQGLSVRCKKSLTGLKGTNNSNENLTLDEKSIINIFPNPSNGKFYIKMLTENINIKEIEIFSIQGQLLFIEKYGSNNLIHVDISNIPAGIYILKVLHDNGEDIERIVKN